jgi:mannan endo-1,4-beta-mannosidase
MGNLYFLTLFTCLFGSQQGSQTTYTPIDKQATLATISLYNNLVQWKAQGVMLGHQDDLAYGHSWYKEPGRSDVKDLAGDYPAVIGWELGNLELGAEHNLDSVYFADMRQYIKETFARGGITTLSWHGNNIATGGSAWDCKQDTVVANVLEGGRHHQGYLAWLDRLADFFLSLKGSNNEPIPVVFRMYHEHTGGWFWWGNKQCTPEEYKKLWRMTVDYLRNNKNVHNLLYAYSPATVRAKEEFFERYPGDDYVDIIGYDCYLTGIDSMAIARYRAEMQLNLRIITAYAEAHHKIPIIGETGLESVKDTAYYTDIVYPLLKDYNISWILFWRNAWEADKSNHYYIPYKGHKAAGNFNDFVRKPRVLLNKAITKE